ncbi:hypothetical protein D3C72_796930 [compost metagenome]
MKIHPTRPELTTGFNRHVQPFFLGETRHRDNLQRFTRHFHRALGKALHVHAHSRHGDFIGRTAHGFQPSGPEFADRQHHVAATKQLLIFTGVMVQHLMAGDVDPVENGRDFAVNHPQLAQFCCRHACRAKVGDKHIGAKWPGRLPANRGEDQVARFSAVAGNVERPPG